MTATATRRIDVSPIVHLLARPPSRIVAGLLTAAALLTLVTLLHIHVPGASQFSRAGYLGAVIAAALVGGRFTAWLAVPAAALLADYYVTDPLHAFTLPWNPHSIVFLIVTAVVAALAVVASRSITRTPARDVTAPVMTVTEAVDEVFRVHAHARSWAAVYKTDDDGTTRLVAAPAQADDVTARQLAAGAHGALCKGHCERCEMQLAS